jgi:hypothetical protein
MAALLAVRDALAAILELDDGDKPDLWHFEKEFEDGRAAIAKLDAEIAEPQERRFAGWFRELPSGMNYRLWEQCGAERSPGAVALYEE